VDSWRALLYTAPLMNQLAPETNRATPLRVVLLADNLTLEAYGPVLRRLAVGLIDELAELSLVCLDSSRLLDFLPSPPVRLITQASPQSTLVSRSVANTTRQAAIPAPTIGWTKKLFPNQQIKPLAKLLTDYKPTLIHAMSEKQISFATQLSQALGIPYLISLLSEDKISSSDLQDCCAAILPTSTALVKKIRQNHPHLANRTQRLPIGTHVADKTACFSRDQSFVRIFCCSPLENNLGLSQLINAVKRASNNGSDLQLTLCGYGSAQQDLRHQVKKLDLAAQVTFLPPISEMISISDAFKVVLSEADIYIQPGPATHWQPELLEAMSVGCAVIIAQDQESDLIINRKTALTSPAQDENALFEALNSLLADHAAAQTLAQNAQKHLKKHFLVSQMISTLVEAYKQATELKA
jgi:glycosyltransferase involved in cell wall biosynthesis